MRPLLRLFPNLSLAIANKTASGATCVVKTVIVTTSVIPLRITPATSVISDYKIIKHSHSINPIAGSLWHNPKPPVQPGLRLPFLGFFPRTKKPPKSEKPIPKAHEKLLSKIWTKCSFYLLGYKSIPNVLPLSNSRNYLPTDEYTQPSNTDGACRLSFLRSPFQFEYLLFPLSCQI